MLRTSATSDRDSEVVIFAGAGAPAGGELATGQTLGSSQRALYLRSDGTVATTLYLTVDGGTNWTAVAVP